MGVVSSIDFKYSSIEIVDIVCEMVANGWSYNDNGNLSYLPLGDLDFDWKRENLERFEKVVGEMRKKEQGEETVGIVLFWEEEDAGIIFNGFPKEKMISLILSINRKVLNSSRLTDFSWYIERISACVQNKNLETVTCYDQL